MQERRNVFVIGSNGYIGLAVSRAFVRAGDRVFGLIRRPEAATQLIREEVTPIVGPVSSSAEDHAVIASTLRSAHNVKSLDIIVMCTQVVDGYEPHFADVLTLIHALIRSGGDGDGGGGGNNRPLVLWTSGSKDYGQFAPLQPVGGGGGGGGGGGDQQQEIEKPHTESDSPISNSPAYFQPRAQGSLKAVFDPANAQVFDGAVLRPTNVYGGSSSYYGMIFEFGAKLLAAAVSAKEKNNKKNKFEIKHLDPRTITHALHVDDCAEAYVMLADAHFAGVGGGNNSSPVAGQCFNIGASRYETVEEIVKALVKEFGIEEGAVAFAAPEATNGGGGGGGGGGEDEEGLGAAAMTLTWHQWIDSTKLRRLTGWTDKRMLFTENMGVYRRAYESARDDGHADLVRVEAMKKSVIDKLGPVRY